MKYNGKEYYSQGDVYNAIEEENRKLKDDSYNELQRLGLENYELREENRKLKSKRDKWRGKYNRLKSEFNLLKNKIGTTQK